MEEKGLRVNVGKTKVMRCRNKIGQAENSGKFPCGICKKGVGTQLIVLFATYGYIRNVVAFKAD